MDEIILDASGWKDNNDFYDNLLAAIAAPEWHGRNLDALSDSIRGNDLNQRKLPYSFYITGADSLPEELSDYMSRFFELIKDLREAGVDINIRVHEK
jgi:RNAse (barnase) inhibitor barstar